MACSSYSCLHTQKAPGNRLEKPDRLCYDTCSITQGVDDIITTEQTGQTSSPGIITIRPAERSDFPFILKLNEENVTVLSPLDGSRLEALYRQSAATRIAVAGGQPAAFFIAFREGADYDSENYRWFSGQYPKFLYIDRIVIDRPFRKLGLGRALYQHAFRIAEESGVPVLTAEIDTVPYNETSLRFHEAMGFREVGTQWVRNHSIRVSLQAAPVPDCFS